MSKKEEIIRSLKPLFEKAEDEGLFFYSNYQQLWFSPNELREHHKKGTFIWGEESWSLRDPIEESRRMKQLIENTKIRLEEWEEKIKQSNVKPI